jgi:hypothetical protein
MSDLAVAALCRHTNLTVGLAPADRDDMELIDQRLVNVLAEFEADWAEAATQLEVYRGCP